MDDDQINDLKHFIENTLDNKTADIKSDIYEMKQDITGMKQDISEMKKDITEMKQDIADIDKKADTIIETLGDEIVSIKTTQQDHAQRISKLESVTA